MKYKFGITVAPILMLLILAQMGCQPFKPDDPHPLVAIIGKLLPDSSEKLVQKLRTRLSSSDADLRREGVAMLGEKKPAQWESTPKILRLMAKGDADAHVRAKAVQVLATIADNDTLREVLATTVNDRSSLVRLESVYALGGSQQDWTAPLLLERLEKDPDFTIRSEAAALLGDYRRRDIVLALIAGLGDSEFAVSYRARQSLRKLTGKDFGDDIPAWREWLLSSKDPFADSQS